MSMVELASILGIIFGLTGAVLGSLSYFRDNPKIVVTLQWDMKTINMPKYDKNKNWGLVTITNIGRRTVYINAAVLTLPKKYDLALMLFDNPSGHQKLGEGDPPAHFVIDQSNLVQYAEDWRKIIAEVKLSTGKIYKSKRIKKNKIPSWTII